MAPGGSSVRPGTFVGENVVIMPPSYINIGAFIDNNTMIDSHVLIGSCAQIGKNVHVSAGVKLGGVLEPIGNIPVIIENNCFIGAGVIIVEGIIIKEGAIIAPGVTLSASIPIYDTINKKIIKGYVPENAVVVPGNRKISSNQWEKNPDLSLNCAVIIKYKDQKTNNSIQLESNLR